jgi:hypothetical protein
VRVNPDPINNNADIDIKPLTPVAGRSEPSGLVGDVVGVGVVEVGARSVVVVRRSVVVVPRSVVVVPRSVVVVARGVVVAARSVVGVTEACTHDGSVKMFVSRVTAPLRASRRPSMRAFVVAVIEVRASTVPTKVELVPSVAELPTCQKTRHAFAPLIRVMVLDDDVINVEFV